MSGDKFDQLYNALKADGAVSGSRANFRNFVYASGKHGYLNRKKLYDALHADGAVSSKSYEEFAQRLGLHATNPQPRVATSQPQQQASRPQTAAQMAISQGYRKQQHQQPVDYLHRPQSQRGKAPVGAPKNASPFVQSLYEVDNAKNGADYPVNYSSPKGVQQVYEQNQRVRKQAAKSAADHIASDEYRRQSQPMIDNGTVGVMKPMGEIEQEMSDSASKFVDANLGDYINNAVLSEQNAAAQRGLDAANNVPLSAGAGGMGLMVKGMAYNKEVDPDLMAKHLTDNARNGFLKMFQDPNFVAKVENEATRLGVTPEAYMESIIPHLKDRLATSLQQSEYQKALPKNMLDNIANRFIDSNTIGKALRLATQTRGQRILSEQASAATAEGKNPYYKGGTVENVAADVAGMVADPIFGASAKLGGAVSGKLIGNSTKIGALMANGNLAQRLGLSGVQAVTSGGVTGFTFGATSGAIQNFSTGEDTSLGGTLKAMLASGASEAGSFATMSLAGVPLGQFGRSIGLKSVKTTPLTKDWFKYGSAKIGMEAAKTYMEGMGMYLGGYVSGKIEGRNQEFSLFDGTLESLPTAIGFRLTHLAEGLKGKRYDKNGKPLNWWNSTMVKFNEFLTSDKAKVSQYMMTEGEKQQIMNSIDETNAANPGLFGNVFDAAMKAKTELKTTGGILEKPFIGEPTSFGDVERDMKVVETVYDKIIADPNVSWDAKAKFSAMVMGVMPSSRPLMDYVLFTNEVVMKDNLNRGTRKYINEYSKYGELLSKREYTDADEKDKALYTMKAYKEQARLWNAISAVTNIDKNNYDMQNDFYMQGIKNAVSNADIRAFVDGLGIKGSAVEREFTNYAMEKGNVLKIFDSVAKQYGMETADLVKAFNKSAMRRTDREQEACIHLRQIMEFTAFPPNKVHAEQSNLNGKDVASDNNLGTEQPNGEAVKQELNGLRQAEAEMDVLMRDNDVFSQNFKKLQSQGLTNPQIYDWMVQNGLTQEQLEPFAHYINANARVLGMQEATKQKIEEVVSGVVQDWSYKGELNGKKMNGEQVFYVQDSDGRVLIVGSGDVAFDPTTGRAKEDVGDLLICLDPNTKEMVYLKTDDVTFMQTQKPEDFANEYRQRLQMINSQPYNEAAQEQAMQDAGKSENQNQSESIGINQNQNSESNGSEKAPQVDTTSPEASTITAKNNTTKEGLAPQEQPQQTRKFADGTDVPMTKDSKGRPTPDYGAMKPEQAAEILSQDLGDSAEPYVDAQIKQAEKAVKDAEKMKIDMSGEPNDVIEQQKAKAKTIEAAKKQLEQAQNIKKAMTAKAVAETMGKPTEAKVEGANEASGEVAKKFQNAPRLQGNHVSKRLPNGDKISGHYEIVPAESLTPSHDVMNDYKKSEGFPVDAEGRTINDRDYEHDKAAQQTTDQMAQKYSGQAITQVPTVSDEGIVYDGNGRTMAGQKAAKNGTDAEYIEDLMDNAQNYGFTKEQIEQSGIEHPRLVMVTDERLPYDTATFSMFNRNEKKTQSNTEQAVAKAKTLTSEEVGAIVADIEGNGSLDAFFNNSKAINDLVKTLVSKGVIGQNEVAGFMDGPDRLSAQGKEYVKNLLLGSVFKPETIRMLGVDSKIKNAAINGIRAIMDNLKLGDYSLRDELDQAVQLLYEARRSKMSVEDLLKQSSAFEENARDRFQMIAQAMAQALEDKPTTFRELMNEYNNIAKNYNTNEGTLDFYDKLTPEQVVEEFLNASKAIKNNNIKLYGNETGHSETERGNDAAGNEEPSNEAGGAAGTEGNGNAETEPEIKVKKALKRIATEITKQTGIEVVTDEQKAKKALDETENIKVQRASAGSTVSGMEKMPKGLQMNPSVLTDQILNYHGDHIAKLLGEVPEDSTVKYFSAHNGVWYFYRVDHDRNIILDGAISANKDNYREYEQKIKEYYGIDGGAEAIYNYVQEAGFDTGANRNLHDYFLEGGNTRHSAMGERPNESQGEARVEDNRTSGRTLRQGSSEEQSGAIKEFRSANGEVYGFTVDGKIYLDTKKMKPETPLHEYTHLWTEALRNGNPTEWENVKSLFDEVEGLKEEVQKLYPELKGDNLYEEMITTFSGREGAKKLEKVVRGLAKEDGKTVEERAKATGFITKVKEALQKYWKGVADMLHIHFTSAEEVADKVLADWASGFNPNKAFDVNDRDGDYTKNNVEYIVKNTKLPFGKKYGEELSQEEVKSLFYGDNDYSKKYGKLFDRVYDVARKLGIKISFKIPPETYSAYGLADLDNVYLNPILLARGEHKVFPNKKYSLYVKEDTLPHAMLHELIHSVTAYALERYERDKDSMPKELRAAAESLIDLYEATRKATLDYVNEYGRENEQEFIAELSNPNFCKLLKKTNVWTRVKDAIKQFFFPLISSEKNVLDKSWKETNSYKELSSLLDDFLEHSDKGLFEEEIGVQNGEIKGKEEAKEEPVPIMPKPVDPSNPIEKAAEDYKKEHPLSEDEILNTTAFDGLPEDQKQYCIDAALDYLNGEDTSAISEAYYRNAYEKRSSRPAETAKVAKADSETVKAGQAEVSADPMEGIKNAAEGFEQEKAERERKQKEATQKVLNVIKASNEKAKTRKQLEAEKNAADNEFEAFMKELRKKQSGQLNSGFIDQNLIEAAPKMFSLAAKCAYTRIKLGMYDAKEVVKDLRNRFKDAFDGFDKRDVETFYSEIMNQKWRDGDKRMSLNEWAEHYRKLSPEYKEKLEGDSKDAEERKMSEKKFIDRVNIRLGFGQKINGIVELRKMAEECGLKDVKDTDLQELAETAIVQRARGIASSASTNDAKKFELIKKLYENQPSLNQRDSERVMKQQYSTPAPYAFLADMYVKGNGKEVKSALEPSAGNGMLTIGLPMDVVHVNDIDAQRLANLRRQGFKNVTSQDGTQPFADKDVDVVVTNPPFGSATPKEYDGYKISSLEGQMAINALESMKDDGRAAIIIGGKTEYAKNGSLNPKDKAFLGYLYSHYNVEDVINVDGSLYAKQGTTYPTRIILINGRRLDENVFPPVKSKARAESVKDYDELYKRISDDILRGERMDSSIGREEGSTRPELDRQGSVDTHEEGVRMGGQRGGEQTDIRGEEQSGEPSVSGTSDNVANRPTAERETDGGLSDGDNSADRTGTDASQGEGTEARANEQRVSGRRGLGGNDSKPSTSEPTDNSGGRSRGQLQRVDESVRGLSTEKVTYAPRSENPFTLKAVMPADQQEAVNKNLEKLGDADQFLVDELGYNDKEDLYSHLAAEQVDSVALALQQAKKGNAFIIGDMTGIGKGRQAASLIRYAKKQGQVPVYFTKTAGLLSDVYRDLVDIGSPELRPFVFGSDKEAAITDSEGNVKFALPSKSEVKRVLDYIEKNGKLPKEYDYVLTTYSQVSNGVYEFDENGARKERKLAKGKSFGAAALSGQRRRDAIEKLMDNGYLILDESHTAGGDSGQGNYFQHIIQKAKNVTFFSATFAKRPDNMPIYALRTAMNQGGLKSADLIDAVKRGGATLQEIMSQTLTQCGQMIRRERDMTGVTIDWRAIDEPEKVKEQREQYDSIIGLFNDIINFQKTYVSGYVEEQNEAMAAMQASMGIKRGTEALGIKNVPFASKAFNTVQQVLLSLKAKSAAERAIDYLKQGMKPVIALNNTNESQTGNIALGEEMDAPDLGTSLRKGLEGTLRYTSKNAKDESSSGYIRLEDLGDDAVEAYRNLEKKIKETSTGLSLSPIDVIKNELEKAGYKVGELTGRSTEFVYNENGTVTKVKRTDTDKKKLAREFNDGQIDALILNKSAATGISLHASSKYKDQRKRVMIVAQQQLDVNDEVQMRGRIDRTGQVARGAYEYVVSLIPAEQRLLMMFKAKLKSLDANTTSSQKSKFNEMEVADITNKYGDKVVREYMAEHLDLYSRMADPFGWEKSFGDDLSSTPTQNLVVTKSGVGDGEAGADASKLLGRMALLKVAEQEKMLNEIGELYANEIQRLNEMGENDLEITELPLKAKTISKEVWKEGAEPGGDNAFADNTYIEKVNMAILKKPMKAEEVKKAQDGLTGGKSWDEYKEEKWKAIESYFVNKGAEEGAKIEERARKAAAKAREKYIKDAKRGQKDSGMTDEQIAQMAIYQQDNIYKQESAKSEDLIKNLKNKAGMFLRVLETFNTEDAYVLPVDMNKPNELSGFGNSYGRLIDIKITDNFSPNASTVSFATLDGRRKITFPISGMVGSGENRTDVIAAIDRMTRQASGLGDKHLRVLSMDVNNWDKLVSNESRKDGYIVTGNLMQALIDSKNQGVGGQLVKYTTDTGEVKTGILMPDRFKPTDVANEYPISSVADKFELPSHKGGIEQAVSSDGDVKVILGFDHGDTYYQIQVPKSKAKGGKYFLDKDLLSMVRGHNFETRGNRMMANIDESQLRPVLARLSNLGVKVREERKSSDDGTHFREDHGLQYSKTDTKDVKNSRIIPEDVDKAVSSQIEKDYDSAINEAYKYVSEKDKSRLHSDVERDLREFSKMRREDIVNDIKQREYDFREWERSGATPDKGGFVGYRYARFKAAEAAAKRELDYRDARAKHLADTYGLQEGRENNLDEVARIYRELQEEKDKGRDALFSKALDIVKRLGTEFGGINDAPAENYAGVSTTQREVALFIDTLARTSTRREATAKTLLHEMIHQATVGAINLVRRGNAEGLLTPKQIDAVNTILDIYDKAVADGRIHYQEGVKSDYGGKNPYEFAAQMADTVQRKKLDFTFGQKVMNAFKELWNKGDRSWKDAFKDAWGKLLETSDKKKMDKAISDIMEDFNETIDDISMRDIESRGGTFADKLSNDSPVSSHIAQLSEKVGDKVNMVHSADEVTNKQAKEAIEEGKHITGWYDEKTGEVHLYMPNIHDRYTAEKTIWHEVVGHKGMRELFGEDRFNRFLRDVWYDLDKPENADLKKLVMEEMKYNPFNVYNAIEEGIARLAEEGRGEAGFWRNLKNKVSDFLHEIGYRMAPNTKDVKYLLWLSKNLQKNPNDPYSKMRAEAVKYRLDHEDVPDVIAKDGMYQSNDGKARDLGDLPKAEYQEATDGQIHFRTTPSTGTALDRYHRSLDEHGYMFTESYMDNMLSLKNLMTAIVPGKKIEDIASSENPYMLQNTMQGAMSDASKMFEIRQMKPLTDAMSKLLGAFEGKDIDEKTLNFNLYMIRKHGLERNRVFFVRDHIRTLDSTDARAMQKEWDIKKHELGDKLRNGDIDLREYYDQMDEWIRNNVDSDFKADEHDYSGFHGMYGIENSKDPYNDADVIADVMDREAKMEDLKKGSVKDFWSKVNAATSFGLYTDYKGGSQNRETYTKTSQMFDWYVPLRKFDETTAEDIYGYINESGDPSDYIGSVLMSAKGRKSLSETNILAQIGAMGNAAIYRAGNNAIKQAFMRFARNHDSQGLITESKVWLVKDGTNADGSDRWMEAYPQIPKDAAPKTVSNIVSKFEADMKAKEATGDARVLKNKADIGFRFERAKDKSQHAVDVMVNGQTHRFYINGNPRAAQALNGLLKNWNGNDTKYIGAAMRANAKVTRFFAQACTSLNPEFTLRNMVKDYELSTLNLLAKEGAKYTGIFEKYYFGLVPFNGMKSISLSDIKGSNGVGLFAKYRKGTLDMNNKVERYFKEFMENGGETGFVQMLGMKDWTKKYKAEIKSKTSSRSRVAKIVKYGVFGNIEGINEVAENMARFATYCASRDCGRSAVRSAYDAKEVTGNFNRQGSGSAIGSFKNGEMSGFKEFRKDLYGFTSCWLRNFSMFFNAGIQSTNLLLKNAKNNPVGTGLYIATGPMMLAALMPLVNQTLMAMLDDDEKDRNGVKDPYAELPDYVRRNNLCIYTGKGEFATIPLAIETRAFYGLGDLAADVAQNPSDKETGEIAQQALGQIAQLVPVMDYMGTKDFGENPVEASVQAFAPSSIEPWIEWERNKDWKGQQIERRGEFYKNDPAWERANSGTNSSLIELNQFANAQTNDVAKGNEEMLGNEALDAITNPSMLEHYGAGIAKGAGTFSGKIAGVIKKGLITHEEIETKDIPFVRSFFYTPSETSSMQRTKSKFYNYADELSKDMDNVSKLKSKNVDPMKAFQNATDYYNFYNSPKAQQIQILERANKQIKAIQKMRNKQTDTEVIRMADQQIGLIMQGAVEQLDKLN